MKDWRQVKDMIETDLDRIFWDEPQEVTMCKKGIYPSGANVGGQVLGNMLFLIADTQAMGWKCAKPAVSAAIKDSGFTLEQCKNVWRYSTLHIAKMLGNMNPPGCPAPWLNVPKLYEFSVAIDEALPSVASKDELEDLLWSWFNYVDCLNRWFFLVFPWHLGKEFPLVIPGDIEELQRLSER
ncbi:MAG: hypothetical protein NWE89_15345 [Candidatus Bathyarchaeota archaeon]|nr:hypothetical protein [Candidatus Bathyarchaeota archaeon]